MMRVIMILRSTIACVLQIATPILGPTISRNLADDATICGRKGPVTTCRCHSLADATGTLTSLPCLSIVLLVVAVRQDDYSLHSFVATVVREFALPNSMVPKNTRCIDYQYMSGSTHYHDRCLYILDTT